MKCILVGSKASLQEQFLVLEAFREKMSIGTLVTLTFCVIVSHPVFQIARAAPPPISSTIRYIPAI